MSRRRQAASSFPPPCDQCLYRKIRCDKSLPLCQRCLGANLTCTRDVVRRRPGRKKGSGLVIARLRTKGPAEDQQFGSNLVAGGQVQNSNSETPGIEEQVVVRRRSSQHDGRRRSSADDRSRSRSIYVDGYDLRIPSDRDHFMIEPGPPRIALPQRLHHDSPTNRPTTSAERTIAAIANIPNMTQHVDLFFTELYPIWPIVPESSFRKSLNHLEELDLHQTCLLLSICALTALHVPGSTLGSSEPRGFIAQRLIEECLQLRTTFDYVGTATVSTIQTSLFLSCAEVEFQRARSSWFLLREAIMLAQEMGFYETASLSPRLSHETIISLQRTLYLLSLTERGLTLLRNKPFTIIMLDQPPEERFDDEDPRIQYGLESLSQLFKLLDKEFLETWVNGCDDIALVAQARARVLVAQQILGHTTFDVGNLTDVQKADILITQQWLRLVFWQSSMRQGLLSSAADQEALSYHFPCVIAKSLAAVLESLPPRAIAIHGMAIFERIFEIAYSFIDSLSLSHSLTSGLDELRVMFRVLRDSPNSHNTYIQILETKFAEQAADGGDGLVTLLYQAPLEGD